MQLRNLNHQDRQKYAELSLAEKRKLAEQVIADALDQYPTNQLALAWTGGKDSTALLWLVRNICQENNYQLPTILLIDEGDQFTQVQKFCQQLEKKWDFTAQIVHNEDVLAQVNNLGDSVQVAKLNEANQAALQELDFTEAQFPFEPESLVGNHLMKTVPLNAFITEHDVAAVLTGVRWDEQEARAKDDFICEITEPAHVRIEPLLPFSEADIWQLIQENNIPYVSLYEEGYRSLGARSTTSKTTDKPAWQQDLENTEERAGRQQDKEKIMKRLRDLGYM